jgi:carbonic anhydrase
MAELNIPRRLVDGYGQFAEAVLPSEIDQLRTLARRGQHPEIMVIGCCDSRVMPEAIFAAHPGELFVVRTIANVVPPYSPAGSPDGVSAALEFAVQGIGVKCIVVMGHSHCGGVRAYIEHHRHPRPGDYIDNWMSIIAPAAASVLKASDEPDDAARLEQASVVAALDNLLTFPWIAEAVASGRLELVGAYFDIERGMLTVYDRFRDNFVPMPTQTLPASSLGSDAG